MIKRIVAMVLAVVLVIGLLPAWASTGTITQAEKLYQLSLLKGTGTDFNLNGQLTRSDAVAFVIRLLGAEKEALAQKSTITGFSDVSGNEWFVPYVNYAVSKGIINGFKDNTFKPNEFVSEKAFLKMVLVAMGYGYNSDFNWSTIYTFALQQKLITDAKYQTQVQDNATYFRSSVVGVMYDSLLLPLKGEKTTVAQRLVSKGVFDVNVGITLGVIAKDKTPTVIEKVEVKSQTSVEITFNEEVTFTKEDMTLVKASNGKALAITSLTLAKNKATLVTAPTENTSYTLTIKNILDKENFITPKLESGFTTYIAPVYSSNYFRIKTVQAVSKSLIEVYFTQPVTSNAAIPIYFELLLEGKVVAEGSFTKMAASKMPGNTDGISLWFKDYMLINGAEYTIKIKGDMQSQYGVKIGEGSGDSVNFLANGGENAKLTLQNVAPIGDNIVRVVYSKPVQVAKATSITNYNLKDVTLNIPRTPFKVIDSGVGDLKGKQFDVVFTSSTIKDNNQYEFTIKDIVDEFNASTITEEKAPFYANQSSTLPLKLDYVAAINQGMVQAYFNQPIDPSSVNAAITITGLTKHSVVIDPKTPYMMSIYISQATPMVANTNYELKFIAGVKSLLGKDQTEALTTNFAGSTMAATNIALTDAAFVANDTIKVTFASPIGTSNGVANKYVLEYKDSDGKTTKTIAAKSAAVVDDYTLILTFEGTTNGVSYTFKGTNILDYSNQYMTTNVSYSLSR